MAIVKLDPVLKELHGKVGNLVFRRGPNGKTIVSWAPSQRRPKSQKAQKALKARNVQQKKLMQAAHDYAHIVMADPELKTPYEKKAKREKKSAYHLVLSDYLKGQCRIGKERKNA